MGQCNGKTLTNVTLLIAQFENSTEAYFNYKCHGILNYVIAFWVTNTDPVHIRLISITVRKFHSYM